MKNILLIHGYNGIPLIFSYFKEELEKRGYNVIIPEFPRKTDISIEGFFEIFNKYKKYFNNELIVVAHSIGNPMFVKYVSKNNFNIGAYISLAGFGRPFITEGRDDLNSVISLIKIDNIEKEKFTKLVRNKYSIYSDNDHIVPLELLEEFSSDISSESILIEGIGHMGSKSGLDKLPKVIEIIDNI